MLEKIPDLIEKILDRTTFGGKWTSLSVMTLFLGLSIYIYEITTHSLYFQKLERKISLLAQLNNLAENKIEQQAELQSLYYETIDELSQIELVPAMYPQIDFSVVNWIFIFKGLSASLFWIILILLTFIGYFGSDNKLFRVRSYLVIGLIFFIIGAFLPTIILPIVNYLLVPLLTLASFFVMSRIID